MESSLRREFLNVVKIYKLKSKNLSTVSFNPHRLIAVKSVLAVILEIAFVSKLPRLDCSLEE